MKKVVSIENISERLLSEGIESLSFGLKYYDEYCLTNEIGLVKQSVINLHRFVECMLKYFIVEINPLLVFTKSFDKYIDIEKDHVITFDQALTFYINNLEYKLLKVTGKYERNKFKLILSSIKELRNKTAHWFIYPHEVEGFEESIKKIIELVYFVCLKEETRNSVCNKLSSENLKILDDLINFQDRKLENAIQKVEKYISDRTSLDPKENDTPPPPLFNCPDCGKETLILSPGDKIFECTFCNISEEASECSVAIICNPGKIPICYLSSWNEENNSMICEDCERHIFQIGN